MIIFRKKKDIGGFVIEQKSSGKKTGFVPTMGALHQGHISLLKIAKKECGIVISSIFVNPTQFNDPTDFEKYPVTIEKDIDALEAGRCDALFLPSVDEMYPEGISTSENEHYKLGFLETVLDGKYRPGHFQGVCRVVEKLFRSVHADMAFLGQKDYQQCMVIKKLVELKDLGIEIKVCPTLREPDGLAMSSRNMRLTEENRKKAPEIYKTLMHLKQQVLKGDRDLKKLKQDAVINLAQKGFRVDYVETCNAATLEPYAKWDGYTKLVLLAAAVAGDVRLIDNLIAE
jgi:pantoate--beta-alanine ligase